MPTWPSGTKAGTTNVDNGSDLIRLARPDIKQNIDNTNAIIDTFDPSGANNNDVLMYNSTTTKFEPQSGIGFNAVLLEFDAEINFQSSQQSYNYDGGFTIIGGNSLGITTGTNAAGDTKISLPAGTYQIETVSPYIMGAHGTSTNFTEIFKLIKESDDSTIFTGSSATISFYFRTYVWSKVVTFASDTDTYVEMTTRSSTTTTIPHTPLLINRLA